MSLVEKIKLLAQQKKITVAELERILDFPNSSIRKWDQQNPGINKVKSVADYFNVSTDFLLDRTDDPTISASDEPKIGDDIAAFFRLNTSNLGLNESDAEELEYELKDYAEFLFQKAKEKKERRNKKQ